MYAPVFPDLDPKQIHTGLLFSGVVTAIVASSAIAFSVFLLRRWRRLDPAMRAYALIYVATSLVWFHKTLRYLMLTFSFSNTDLMRLNEVLSESFVYLTGLPLYYYLGIRVFHSRRVSRIATAFMTLIAVVSVAFLLLPNGFSTGEVTYFTADPRLNPYSFTLFGIFAGLSLLFLIYDFSHRIPKQIKTPPPLSYNSFYSMALIIYVGLGIIDQSKIIIGWPLVVFRMLYAAAFLFAYLVMVQDEAKHEQYLLPQEIEAEE